MTGNVTLDAALDLTARGYAVIPVGKDKIPLIKNWTATRATRDLIYMWWGPGAQFSDAQIGILTQSLVALDFDDPADYDKFAKERPHLLEGVPVYRTPRPGVRVIYRAPPGYNETESGHRVKSTSKETRKVTGYPNLDVKSYGGQVLVPPSRTENGVYEYAQHPLVEMNIGDIPYLPQYWFELLEDASIIEHPRKKQEANAEGYTDDDVKFSAEYYLEKYLNETREGSRNAMGYQLATQMAALMDAGLLTAEAERIMGAYARGVPTGYKPYTEREALASLRSALSRSHLEPAVRHRPRVDNPSPAEEEITAEAMRLLNDRTVNLMDWLVETVQEYHKSDDTAIRVLISSLIVAHVKNSSGINPSMHGPSGKGKTSTAKGVKHIAPPGKVYETSLSTMALYYMTKEGRLKPGTIVFCDDLELGEDIKGIVKRSTSNFQEKTTHNTVIRNKGVELVIPEQIGWWLTSVNSDDSDQILNRQMLFDADASEAGDKAVHERQRYLLRTGEAERPVSRRVLVAREILRIVCDGLHQVAVPFEPRIKWANYKNRRTYPMFGDLLRCQTVLNRFHRDRDDEIIIASEDDFNAAARLYRTRAKAEEHKLVENEMKVYDYLMANDGEIDVQTVMKITNMSRTGAIFLMNGRNNDGGMCAKVPGLNYEKQNITIYDVEVEGEGIRERQHKTGSVGRPRMVWKLEEKQLAKRIDSYDSSVYLESVEKK